MAEHPTVTVVMPVRNERATIEATLDAVLAQSYEGQLDVVVAEGGSTDGTAEYLHDRASREPRLTVVENLAGTAAAGLNTAIDASEASVIVRCDGHSLLSPDYVATATEVLRDTGAANVGGRQDAVGHSTTQRAIAIAMTSPLGVGNSRFHYSDAAGPSDTVYLGVFKRSAIDALGGFDESLLRNQDYDLNHRLIESGRMVWFDPRLRVEYTPRASLRELWRQYRDYGSWKRAMLRKSPKALKPRQLAPPALIVGLVLSAVLAAMGFGAAAAVVPVAYMAFLALGALVELLRRRDVAALLLPPVLATMHLAWGSAFLLRPARL